MLVNRDPDGLPMLTDTMCRHAKELGLHIVQIICDEDRAEIGDQTGVSFFALVSFIPRQGDRIKLDDGRTCEVEKVYFKIARHKDRNGKDESLMLMPNVYALLVEEES